MRKNFFIPCALGLAFLFSATACSSPFEAFERSHKDYEFAVYHTKKKITFKFTPTRDLIDVVVTFELYSQDETLFEKYNKHLFTTFERTIERTYANEPYLIQYELDKELYPDKIIADVEVYVEYKFPSSWIVEESNS